MKFALIPAGEFMMGSPDDDSAAGGSEKPQHRVRITRPFYLGVHEVTQAQYQEVMGNNPSFFSSTADGKAKVAGQSTDQNPVECVSWLDAAEFCNKLSEKEGLKPFYELEAGTARVLDWRGLGYRLPTEAEWEYACRANSKTQYTFGNNEGALGEHGWYGGNSGGQTHPVGQKRPNAFGLFDMHGNIREWCWDDARQLRGAVAGGRPAGAVERREPGDSGRGLEPRPGDLAVGVSVLGLASAPEARPGLSRGPRPVGGCLWWVADHCGREFSWSNGGQPTSAIRRA